MLSEAAKVSEVARMGRLGRAVSVLKGLTKTTIYGTC